jgi:hypothetical protein
MLLADAPQPSWAGILTAFAVVVLNLGGLVTAISLAMYRRRTSKRLDAYQRDTTARLSVIHTLVNSTLTTAKSAQLAASRRELVMLLELTTVQRQAGTEPSDERLTAIGALRRDIDQLVVELHERYKQHQVADMQEGRAALPPEEVDPQTDAGGARAAPDPASPE